MTQLDNEQRIRAIRKAKSRIKDLANTGDALQLRAAWADNGDIEGVLGRLMEEWYQAGVNDGNTEGFKAGYAEGHENGYDEGYADATNGE